MYIVDNLKGIKKRFKQIFIFLKAFMYVCIFRFFKNTFFKISLLNMFSCKKNSEDSSDDPPLPRNIPYTRKKR